MADTGWKSPGTMANADRDGKDSWVSPDDAKTQNDNWTDNGAAGDYTDWLRATNFSMGVPAGANIDGIIVEIDRWSNGIDSYDSSLRLRKTIGQVGEDKPNLTDWPLSDTDIYQDYGGIADLWETSWSAEDINSVDFGMDISIFSQFTTMRIDHIRIKVYYTEGGIRRAYASGSITLNQTSYTQVSTMALSPSAGNYLAVFNMQVQYAPASVTDSTLKVAIYVDGVQQQHSIRTINQNSSLDDMYWGITTTAYVSPGTSEVVEVRYIVDNGTTPMTGTNRELNLFPAVGTNFQDTDVVTDTTATASWTTLDTMTRTPPANDYLLVFSTTCESSAVADTVGFRLSVGGAPVVHTIRHSFLESSADPSTYIVMITASISPGGSDVVEIEWSRISGLGTQSSYERNMILIEIPSTDIFQAQGTVTDAETTADTDKQIDDMIITTPGATDYLVFFNSYDFYPSISSGAGLTTYKIYEDGAEDTNLTRIFEHEDSLDNTFIPIFLSGRITLGAGSIQAYWRSNTTIQRSIYTRSLVAIREPTTTYKLEGVTYDKTGSILGSVDCYLYKDNQDGTVTFEAHVVSNGGTGVYSFTGIGDNDAQYIVVGIEDSGTNRFDMTDNVRTPVLE